MKIAVIVLLVLLAISWFILAKALCHCRQFNEENKRLKRSRSINQIYINNLICLRLLYEKKINMKNVLLSQGIKCVSIYGMGKMGKVLLEELCRYDINVHYGIDKKKMKYSSGALEVRQLNDVSNDTDMIIVTPELDYDDIYKQLRERVSVPIVRLSDFLNELLRVPESIDE